LPIYLDHSASTQVWPAVVEQLSADLTEFFANPSSAHRLGQAAEKKLTDSKRKIAKLLGCHQNELLLTSGGSESINLAIKGYLAANPRQGLRVLSSQGEHAATAETLTFLRQQGYCCEEISLQPDGCVDLVALAKAMEQPAALLSLIHVSNESGAVNNLAEIVRLRNQLQPQMAIHLDAVQTLGRQPLNFHRMGVDLLSGSGHKVGAPKGIGFLLIKQGVHLQPLIHGGGHQHGLRSGTENPPLAAALAQAIELTAADYLSKENKVRRLRAQLLTGLQQEQVDFQVLSSEHSVPQILLISFPGLRGETMLHALEAREIYISSGAACSSKHKKANRILQAMTVPAKMADCAIRISLAASNTEAEINATCKAMGEICRWLIQASN
jgi:cysteine desulfurase